VNKISHEGTDHFIAICRNISTRKRQAESLAEIHTASQDLVRAPDQDTLVRRLVSAADAVLDVNAATVYQFDEVQNVLLPVESLEHTESWPEPAAIEPGAGVRWDAFATETNRLVEAEFTQYLQDAPPGTRLAVVPIGEFGLLQCVSSDADGFDEQQLELIETLVANAEAVLTRVEKERELEHRETELQQQTAQLERLDSINKQVRRITQRLLDQRTEQDVFSTVCAGLAELDQYELVWIGNQGESVVTPVATGGQSSYTDANAPFEIGSHSDTDPAGRTAETGEVTAIQRVATELHDGDWQADALAQNLLSVASVPIEYRSVPYGTLTVYANQTDAFDESTLDILRECGDAVAQVCHQIEQKEARRRGEVTEVTFSVEEPQTPFLSFIDGIDGQASVFKIVHRPEMTRVYCRLEVPSGTDIEQTATAISGFQSLHRIEKTRYRCDVDPPAQDIFQTIVNSGGAVETVAATDDNPVTITASFPETGCSSNVLSTVTQQYGSVAITETQSAEPTGYFVPDLFADLTDRQYDALETAFQQGYFSWPRQSTGKEIAAEMDVAPSTFTEHLRRAEASIVNKLMAHRKRG
jgi:transcriptional regulator with GAF, ATPase, and Fis domain